MEIIRTRIAWITRRWPSFLFMFLVAIVVGMVWLIPHEIFQMLHAFLKWLDKWVPHLTDNFAFLLGIGPFYMTVTVGVGILGFGMGFLAIERRSGLTRRLAGAFTMATLTMMVMLTLVLSLSGAPTIAPLAAGMFSATMLVALLCGLTLVLSIVGLALLIGRSAGLVETMVRMATTVPSWLAAPGLWATGLALYSWFNLDPIRPVVYLFSSAIVALGTLIIPGVIQEARRRA